MVGGMQATLFTQLLLPPKLFHTVMKQQKRQEQNYFQCGILLVLLQFFFISPGYECSFRIKLFVNQKMVLLPQGDIDEKVCITDLLFRSKLRIDNPGAPAREFNSIMQVVIESLIGWNTVSKKQTNLGIFGKVLGWCDTTEEQARFSLHSHVLLFIDEFDVLVNMLWSTCDTVKEEAQKKLKECMKITMCFTYDLLEEDYIHEKPINSKNKVNEKE
jgi:hypothetical protein